MLTLPAFSPAPVEYLKYLPASSGTGRHTDLRRARTRCSPGYADQDHHLQAQPGVEGASDPVRKAYVDKIDDQRDGEPGLHPAAARRPARRAPTWSWTTSRRRPQLPGLIAANDPNLNIGDRRPRNPYIVFNMVSPNNNGAMANAEVPPGAGVRASTGPNIIQVLGGPTVSTRR